MLKCAECVTSASEKKNSEIVRVSVCVWICVHHPFGLSLSECKFEESSKTNLHSLILVATSRTELVFFLAFKTRCWHSNVVGYCDCRHVCDDEESHVTMFTKTTMTTVLHRVWSCFPFSTVPCACILGVVWSSRCCSLLLDWVFTTLYWTLQQALSVEAATYIHVSFGLLSKYSMSDREYPCS